MMAPLLAAMSLCAALAEPPAAAAAQVEVTQPRAEWLGGTASPRLKMTLQVANHLPFAVRRLQVGVLYAASPEALRGRDPGALYKHGADTGIGVLHAEVDVQVPAQGGTVATFIATTETTAAQSIPAAYVTHVLGYMLDDADAPTLLRLQGGMVAADAVAACNTLAITGTSEAKRAARQRFGHDAALAQGLIDVVAAPAPPKPSQAETFRRVYAIRALGVLGSEAAGTALRTLASTDLSAWDEPLQVLRIARISGSPWETPLAYALPDRTRRMVDVVNAAVDDAVALPPPLAELDQNVTVAEANAAAPPPAPQEEPPSWRWWALAWALVLAAALWRWRRGRDGAR